MEEVLCKIMGILDIIAGVVIALYFGFKAISLFFGAIMIVKGGMSFL